MANYDTICVSMGELESNLLKRSHGTGSLEGSLVVHDDFDGVLPLHESSPACAANNRLAPLRLRRPQKQKTYSSKHTSSPSTSPQTAQEPSTRATPAVQCSLSTPPPHPSNHPRAHPNPNSRSIPTAERQLRHPSRTSTYRPTAPCSQMPRETGWRRRVRRP